MASGVLTSYITNPACLAGQARGLLGQPAPHLPVTPPPFPDVRCREGLIWSDEWGLVVILTEETVIQPKEHELMLAWRSHRSFSPR